MSGMEGLIAQINEINQAAQQKANAGRIPGGAGLEAISSGNISSALSGQLDPSVLQQLGQRSAERGIMTGSPSGPGTNAEYLRSLGLTSLDLMGQGQNWLTQATGRNPAAPIYSAGNQVLTAEQQQQADFERQRLALQQQQLALERQRLNQEAAFRQQALDLQRRGNGGGGGLGGGGSVAGGTRTGGGGSPAINWADVVGGGGWSTDTPFNSGGWTPGSWSNTNPSGGAWGTSSSFIGDPWDDPNQPIFQPAGDGPISDFTDPYDPGYWASGGGD